MDQPCSLSDVTPSHPPSILIVDDDPSIVHLLKEFLSSEGYNVLCGYDGQMAIQLAREQRPNLIIMDVNMPVTSGLKAFEYIRKTESTAKIPVIFVSGELSRNVYPVIAEASRVAHLKKPMDLENLHSMIREFLLRYPIVVE